MSSFLNLRAEDRDELLITIPYVEQPIKHGGFGEGGVNFGGRSLVNYSQVYASCTRCLSLPSPSKFRTGDLIQTHDYRGCGTYYAIWLHKGLVAHSEQYIANFKRNLVESPASEVIPEVPETFRSMKKSKRAESVPRIISRFADGPHNDGDHDLYLSQHYDEFGYAPSIALSSSRAGYYLKFEHSEYENLYFDPIITHTRSHCGEKVAAAKLLPEHINNPNFPDNFLGHFDANQGKEWEMEWIDISIIGDMNGSW